MFFLSCLYVFGADNAALLKLYLADKAVHKAAIGFVGPLRQKCVCRHLKKFLGHDTKKAMGDIALNNPLRINNDK